jgi:phosphomannomutase/phosphoglucomutase
MSLIEEVRKAGGTPVISRTGYPLVQQKMWEVGAELGGEMSGHLYIGDNYYGYDDGIFSGLKLLEILSETDGKFSDILSDIPAYPATPEIRLDCPNDEIKFKIIEELRPYFEAQEGELIDIDGYRLNFNYGWGLVRASNTQPILVLRFEAKTEEQLELIKAIFRKKLSEYESVTLDF